VHPYLEYCIHQAYTPWLKKDIECLEKVQWKATNMVHGFHNLRYHDRLSQLGLSTLKNRRLSGDLIEMYKLLTNQEDIDSKQFFHLTGDPSYDGTTEEFTKPEVEQKQEGSSSAKEWWTTGTTYHRKLSMQTMSTVSNQDLTSSDRKLQIWDNKPPLLSHQHQVQVQVPNLPIPPLLYLPSPSILSSRSRPLKSS